jgi:hypothetical protein
MKIPNIHSYLQRLYQALLIQDEPEVLYWLEKLKMYSTAPEAALLLQQYNGDSKTILPIVQRLLEIQQIAQDFVNPRGEALSQELRTLENRLVERAFSFWRLQKQYVDYDYLYHTELFSVLPSYYEKQLKQTTEPEAASKLQEKKNIFIERSKKYFSPNYFTPQLNEQNKTNELFHKGLSLCAPQIVCSQQKKEAESIYTELIEAYLHNDYSLLQDIVATLECEDWLTPLSAALTEIEEIETAIKELTVYCHRWEQEIALFKDSETYAIIANITNPWEYVQKLKNFIASQL